MDSENTPIYQFLGKVPAQMDSMPLPSALQTWETSLLLISLGRFAHALTNCASSCESAIKAAFAIPQDNRDEVWKFFNRARDEKNAIADIPNRGKFLNARNRIIHYGFSPKDDSEAAFYLLKTGIPLFRAILLEYFDYDPIAQLWPGTISEQLQIALRVFEQNLAKNQVSNHQLCFAVLMHVIAAELRDQMASLTQAEVEESSSYGDAKFQASRSVASNFRIKGPDWDFEECPVCPGYQSLKGILDDDELDKGQVSIRAGYCCFCGMTLPTGFMLLNNEVCRSQIDTEREKILSDYGIKV